MDLYQALRDRRSIRKYKPDPVPEEKLTRILDAARMAPSWSNLQCWKFIIVRDPHRKKILADSIPGTNPAARAVGKTAPAVVVLCADPRASGNHDGKDYYLLDAGLAMQQLMLAAYAEGLGTCWIAWFDEAKARAACDIPAEYRVVALSPLGVPVNQPSTRLRKEISEIVYKEEWGKPL